MSSFSPVTWILARQAATGAVEEAISGMGDGMTFKGTVPTPNDLPSTHNNGDMWIIEDMNPDVPGAQGGKAVWYGAQWHFFDQVPSNVSELANDAQYLSSKVNSGNYLDNIHVDGNRTAPSSNAHEYIIKDVQFKRGTDSSLASYVPKAGEPVFEQSGNTYRLKIGNGSSTYANLPYIGADFTPDVDGRSVNIVGTNLQVYGFNTAQVGAIPRKTASGLEWIKLADVIDVINGIATSITKVTTTGNGVQFKVDVLTDSNTIKVNGQNKLYVPIDNDTIKVKSSQLTARKTVAGQGINVTTNSNDEYVVSGNYKAGANINLEVKSDGIYINSTAAGGVGVVQAGDGIKVTASGDRVTVSGDYQAGDYIHIDKNPATGKLEISVDPSAVSNTYRPVYVNGSMVLDQDPTTGFLGFKGSPDTATGLNVVSRNALDGTKVGKEIEMSIANTGIIQAQEIGTPHRALATLTGRLISLHAGNADFSNVIGH